MDLTKQSLKRALGVTTDAELARLFDISRSAVHQWADNKPIPQGRYWQMKAQRPELFKGVRGKANSGG